MAAKHNKAPIIVRFAVLLFTGVLGILCFWFLGFLIRDVGSLRGPEYKTIEKDYVSQDLLVLQENLSKKAINLQRQIKLTREKNNLIRSTSRTYQSTLDQVLTTLRRLPEFKLSHLDSIAQNLQSFEENQQQLQSQYRDLDKLIEEKAVVEQEIANVKQRLDEQRRAAREAHRREMSQHRMLLGLLQIAILLPILGLSGYLLARKREGLGRDHENWYT